MGEWKLFPDGIVPECTTPEWYAGRERAPHLEQAGHRDRLLLTAEFANWLATTHELCTVSDLGCGDGGLLFLLAGQGFTAAWGYDLSPEAVKGARERGVDAVQLDVVNGRPRLGELVVVTEILEHLIDPHAYVRRLSEGASCLVASSPWNESDASHYEFHTWAWDRDGYRALFEDNGWRVVRQEPVHGFQVVAAVGKS